MQMCYGVEVLTALEFHVTSKGYDVRQEADGTWTVFDIFTGQPAEVGMSTLNVLSSDEAVDIVRLLNRFDAKRRPSSVTRRRNGATTRRCRFLVCAGAASCRSYH